MPLTFQYADDYVFDWTGHVFPVAKYRLVKEELLRLRLAAPSEIEAPPLLELRDVANVHRASYLERLLAISVDPLTAMREFEIPISRRTIHAVLRHVAGTRRACERALEHGAAVNLGGGFHHAFPDHGEGFCFVNDVAFALQTLLDRGALERAAVIDLDVHQGNGTARCFAADPRVFTFSVHQRDLYPVPKEVGDLDVELESGSGDHVYLAALERHLPIVLERNRPDLVVYLAGADPFEEDQLGGLGLTRGGFVARDEMVFAALKRAGVPVAVVLAGGYARRIEDVVGIHTDMVRVLRASHEQSSATA